MNTDTSTYKTPITTSLYTNSLFNEFLKLERFRGAAAADDDDTNVNIDNDAVVLKTRVENTLSTLSRFAESMCLTEKY